MNSVCLTPMFSQGILKRKLLETIWPENKPELKDAMIKLLKAFDRFMVIFLSNAEGYIADIPDLEACSAFGETPDEALHIASYFAFNPPSTDAARSA